jgi:hypothetical protein
MQRRKENVMRRFGILLAILTLLTILGLPHWAQACPM